ncbi:hypothetical protein K6Y31_03175 [Motilimonas cestriensis]|uniref:Uncharacterized protein n=1 Tax=Motilimonas cestriensis TaxID=2742685 RepID=A0ABS8W7T6_9GAMM|nr:hypothetical protein [Motilimonas cestriensis]MCE2593811.1 hypothetical protein [Motilimonas cestriensis]
MEHASLPEEQALQAQLQAKDEQIKVLEAKVANLNKRIDERTLTLSQHLASLRGNNAQVSPLNTLLLQIRTRVLNDVTRNIGMPDSLAAKREYNLLVIAATEFIKMLEFGATRMACLAADFLDDCAEKKDVEGELIIDLSEGLRTLADGFNETIETAYYWVPDRIDTLKADSFYDDEEDTVPAPDSLPAYITLMRHPQFSADNKELNVLLTHAFDIEDYLVE